VGARHVIEDGAAPTEGEAPFAGAAPSEGACQPPTRRGLGLRVFFSWTRTDQQQQTLLVSLTTTTTTIQC
jgi:hypothetical protein